MRRESWGSPGPALTLPGGEKHAALLTCGQRRSQGLLHQPRNLTVHSAGILYVLFPPLGGILWPLLPLGKFPLILKGPSLFSFFLFYFY